VAPDSSGVGISRALARTRPRFITFLAVLDWVGAVLSILYAIVGLFVGARIAERAGLALPGPALVVNLSIFVSSLIGALVAGLIGYGLMTGKRWTWVFYVLVLLAGLLGSVVAFRANAGAGIAGILLDAALLAYFLAPGVRRWFGPGQVVPRRPVLPALPR
jgi:hypothetical protein